MSLKRNILSSLFSQSYVTAVGIGMVPVYIKFMGVETYGLVGFFTMLQAWFMMLDMGLTPTLAREMARFRGGGYQAADIRLLLRALEGVFAAIALLGAAILLTGADFIAAKWLKVDSLPLIEVRHAVMLMAVIVAIRWIGGLYRSALSGFEHLSWLGNFNILVATTRFVLVVPFLAYVGSSPTQFFLYQLVVVAVEVFCLIHQTYRLMPEKAGRVISWQWQPLRGVFKFSLAVAFSGAVWVLVTQTDKLILSAYLPLTDYAYFTLAVQVASALLLISGPIGVALMPRLSRLQAEGDETGLLKVYRDTTQFVAILVVPLALVMGAFAGQILWAWTGNSDIASQAAGVLRLYALGNGVLALAAFPYYLQFAKGDLHLHLIGNALFVVLFIPLLAWATRHYGMIGAGYAWIAANLLPFLLWLPMVHGRFAKGLHLPWMFQDIVKVIILPVVFVWGAMAWIPFPSDRLEAALMLVMLSLVACLMAIPGSSAAQTYLRRLTMKRCA